jgi:predicted P-loop ATPase
MKSQLVKVREWVAVHWGKTPRKEEKQSSKICSEEVDLIIYLVQHMAEEELTPATLRPEIQKRLQALREIKAMVVDCTEELDEARWVPEPDLDPPCADMPLMEEVADAAVSEVSSETCIAVSTEDDAVVSVKNVENTSDTSVAATENVTAAATEVPSKADEAPSSAASSEVESSEPFKPSKRDLSFGKMMEHLLIYMKSHYHLRYNVLTDVTELGREVNHELVYQPITRRQMNTLCVQAQVKGLGCWEKDLNRCIDSEYVESYHPFKQYIDALPAWDGIDRVTPLAQRVSHNDHWVNHFHIWMRGMLAQWMGLFQQEEGVGHAHTLAPILVSPEQGCGKSTFCKSLLPKELRAYYTDSFDVYNNNAGDKSLAKNGLINIDEFDMLTKQGQTRLKNHMQKTELTYRVGNQKQATFAPRLASFIGTTNQREIMTDPTGSRRFICVEVEGIIDNNTPIDYPQLYAQLKQELAEGATYWLNKEEEKQLERDNRAFYRRSQEEEIFFSMFRLAEPGEEGAEYLSATQLYDQMRQKHRSALKPKGGMGLAKILTAYQKPKHTSIANLYCVVRRS